MQRIAAKDYPKIVEAVKAATNKLPNNNKRLRISVSFLDENGKHWQINPSECGVCHISMVFISENHVKIWFDEEAIMWDLKSKYQEYVRKVKVRLERLGYNEDKTDNMEFMGFHGWNGLYYCRVVLEMKKGK